MKLNQNGFAAVLAFLIITAVALAGAVIYVYQTRIANLEPMPSMPLNTAEITRNQTATSTPTAAVDITDWDTYRWSGLEFKYPANWIFSKSDDDRDFHLLNMDYNSDSLVCEKGFIGMEIQIYNKKANETLQCGEERTSGKKENISIGQNKGYKIEHGGWDASCAGPGFCIGLDDTTYAWIFTGSDSSDGFDQINKIIETIKKN